MKETILSSFENEYSVLIIITFIFLFLWFIIQVYYKNLKIIKGLTGCNNFENQPKKVSNIVKNYQESFIEYKGKQRTLESFKNYFNQEFLANLINLRFWIWVPSLFVGLGILGTFYGLQSGITGFDTNTSDTIQESIKGLLEGTATAFISSLCGIFMSLIFHIVEKFVINSLLTKMYEKTKEFDNRYLLKKYEIDNLETEKIKIQQNQIIDSINDKIDNLLTINSKDGKKLNVINYISNIDKTLIDQRKAFQELIDDFYTNLEGMLTKISADGKDKFDEVISRVLEVNSALGSFKDNTGKEIGDTIGLVVHKLIDQIKYISDDFREAIQDGAIKQINEISNTLASTAIIMEQAPQNIESSLVTIQDSLSNELNKNINKFTNLLDLSMGKYADSVDKILDNMIKAENERHEQQKKDIIDSLNNLKKRDEENVNNFDKMVTTYTNISNEQLSYTKDFMATILHDFSIQFNNILNSYKTENTLIVEKNMEMIREMNNVVNYTRENTNLMHQDIMKITTLNKESIDQFDFLINNSQDLLEKFEKQISNLISLNVNFKSINEQFSKTSESNTESLEILKSITTESEINFKNYIDLSKQTLEMFKATTNAESENIKNQVDNYKMIYDEVNNLFKGINTGLIDYQEVVEKQLNRALSDYTSSFDLAISGLASSVSNLTETLESLEEITNSRLRLVVNGDNDA